jgi:hypothetical protein
MGKIAPMFDIGTFDFSTFDFTPDLLPVLMGQIWLA